MTVRAIKRTHAEIYDTPTKGRANPVCKNRIISDVFDQRVAIPAKQSSQLASTEPSARQNVSQLSTPTKNHSTPQKSAPQLSPTVLHTPIDYHTANGLAACNRKTKKSLSGKKQHTIQPGSADKQFRVLKTHYVEARKLQRSLFDDGEETANKENTLQVNGATIRVEKDQFTVTSGKTRTFGVHVRAQKNGELLARAYPVSGDGVIPFTGQELSRHLASYEASDYDQGFQNYLDAQLKKAVVPVVPVVLPAVLDSAAASNVQTTTIPVSN